jgi:hypothetical protein
MEKSLNQMEDSHKVCELEKEIAVLKEQAKGTATALILADKVATSNRTSLVAVVLALLALLARFIK